MKFQYLIVIATFLLFSTNINAQSFESTTEKVSRTSDATTVAKLPVKYIVCVSGSYPSRSGSGSGSPFLAEVKLFAGNFAPAGWMYCDGQVLPINEYTALFSLLGTTYGGDGRNTFALPKMN